MADKNDSIFEFGDKFGIKSPFGNWVEKGKKKTLKIFKNYLI